MRNILLNFIKIYYNDIILTEFCIMKGVNKMSKNTGCLNNYDFTNIEQLFAESEESLKKCNNCEHLSYDNGIIECKLCKSSNNQ